MLLQISTFNYNIFSALEITKNSDCIKISNLTFDISQLPQLQYKVQGDLLSSA